MLIGPNPQALTELQYNYLRLVCKCKMDYLIKVAEERIDLEINQCYYQWSYEEKEGYLTGRRQA